MEVYGVDNQGPFWPQRIAQITEDPFDAEDERRLVYAESDQSLYIGTASEWKKITGVEDIFNDNQRLIFYSTLPTGFTLDTTYDDACVYITSNTNLLFQNGGSLSGWQITGMNSNGQHSDGTNVSPQGHDVGVCSDQVSRGTSEPSFTTATGCFTGGFNPGQFDPHYHNLGTAGGHSHSFDGSWRPPYKKAIIGRYNAS